MRVIWMPQAISDLKTVREYIERDSPLDARLVTERLYNAVGQLSSYPESGRMVPELGRPAVRVGYVRQLTSMTKEHIE